MWEEEIKVVQQYCLKHKAKNKKIRSFFNKLLVIDRAVKEKILSNYMELSRCRHCIMFSRWRLNQLNSENPDRVGNTEGRIFLEESSKSANEKIDDEIDYLMNLHKFRAQKAQKIRRSLFKDVEPGVLDLEVTNTDKNDKTEAAIA